MTSPFDVGDDVNDMIPFQGVIATARSLVSAVRVDSYFSPTLVPSLQVALAVPRVELQVWNQFQFAGRRLAGSGEGGGLGQYVLGGAFPQEHLVRKWNERVPPPLGFVSVSIPTAKSSRPMRDQRFASRHLIYQQPCRR